MTATLERLDLDLPGLLELLGGSLYSDPRVGYRELIQNAHDACVRRRIRAGAGDWTPRIEVGCETENERAIVWIRDNGEGLDPDEIRRFLATIGRGHTREVRSLLEAEGDRAADELVGQFGVGLLAAFLIADRVEVTTRPEGEAPAHRWICEGRQTYRIEAADRREQGTTVRLRVRADREHLAHPEVVADAITHYARYLELPILVDGEPINTHTLPWVRGDGRPALDHEQIAAQWSRAGEPIFTLPLTSFEDPEHGTVPLDGVLAIPEASMASLGELGEVAVLVRHMLITPRDRDLLPPWARFVGGLVDSPFLRPTASREQIRRDERADRVRAELGRQLLAALERLPRASPSAWQTIVAGHKPLLKQWGARHPELFEAIADHIPFDTTRGEMTLPEYRAAVDEPAIYYFSEEQEARTMALLLEATARPVVDAQWFGDLPFLRAYAARHGLRLVRELEAEAGVLRPVEDPAPALGRVAERLAAPDLEVVVARFEPRSLPAFVQTPSRVVVQREVQDASARGQLHRALALLTDDYAEREPPRSQRRRLYLNADCPLVELLASHDGDPRVGAATDLIGAMARTLSGERLSPASMLETVRAMTDSLVALLGAAVPRRDAPTTVQWATDEVGLARAKAERLCERYPTFAELAAAESSAIADHLGIAPAVAGVLRQLARAAIETPEHD